MATPGRNTFASFSMPFFSSPEIAPLTRLCNVCCFPLCQNCWNFRSTPRNKWNASAQVEIFRSKWSISRDGPLWPFGPVDRNLPFHDFKKFSFTVPLCQTVIKIAVETQNIANELLRLETLIQLSNVVPFSPHDDSTGFWMFGLATRKAPLKTDQHHVDLGGIVCKPQKCSHNLTGISCM